MARRTQPPFRADHVGSLLRPQRLLDAREKKKRGEIDAAALRKVEDECIREVVKLQEDVGLQCATDGEFRRTFWHLDFLEQFTNITVVPPSVKASFHTEEGDLEFMPPGIRVDGKLGHPKGIMTEDYAFLIQGLLDLYEASFDASWLRWAEPAGEPGHERKPDRCACPRSHRIPDAAPRSPIATATSIQRRVRPTTWRFAGRSPRSIPTS